MTNARDRTGAAALVGAAVTGLIAFALLLGGGLLLWADDHYKDADGYLTTGSQRFSTQEYVLTTPSLEVGAGAPGFLKVPAIATIGYATLGLGLLFIVATAALTAYGSRPVARRLTVAY